MARTKAVLGAGARLSDYLCASLLARVFPPEAVHGVLNEHGRNSQRVRSFPAVAGMYYCMALSLYPEAAYEEVFAVVAQGLAWASGAAEPALVNKSSISSLRIRLGAAPLADLVGRCCVPLATGREYPEAFYAGRRLVAIDGSCFELPDEVDNAAHFGYPGSRTSVSGHASYPQARCVVLVECATHAILGANIGPYRNGEWALCTALLPRLGPGMLCMADRGFNGVEQWRQASDTGADLLWRCSDTRQLPVQQLLSDGSFLSSIAPSGAARAADATAITVRVIEYAMPGHDQALPRYRLLTTLLDPKAAPAMELARLYHQRWEIEAVFDELKTHLRQSRRVLRSKTPELGAAGVLRLGGGALRGALVAASRRQPPPIAPRGADLQGTPGTSAPRPAPIRGLSPQSVPDAGADGSVSCLTPPPTCGPPALATSALPAWSSGAIRSTRLTIAAPAPFDPSPMCLEPRPPTRRRRHDRPAESPWSSANPDGRFS